MIEETGLGRAESPRAALSSVREYIADHKGTVVAVDNNEPLMDGHTRSSAVQRS